MSTARVGRCPQCSKPSSLEPANRYRPFCGERCKMLDLGDWMSGRFSIPVVEATGETGAVDPKPDQERLQ